jgi:hypothetical protein
VSLVVIHRRASQTIDESLQIAHRLINWWAMFVVVKREIFTCGSVYRHYFVFDRLGETKSVTLRTMTTTNVQNEQHLLTIAYYFR